MKLFDKIKIATTRRSVEDLGCFHSTTTDFGRLDVPYWLDVVEGQDVKLKIKSFFDAACMVVPTRGLIHLNVRVFFVPFRILCNTSSFDWDLWRTDLSNNAHPYVEEMDVIHQYQTLGNPMGKDLRRILSQMALCDRTYNTTSAQVSYSDNQRLTSFPLKAYQRIWWDFYRDSNLIPEGQRDNYIPKLLSGKNSCSWLVPRYCCFKKDYFTTAKVNPQEGSSVVSLGTGISPLTIAPTNPSNVLDSTGTIVSTSANNLNIQFLRAANAFQKLLERYNIAGGRPMARYLARLGQSPDAIRLDQAEYIGGASYTMSIGGITANLQIDSAGGTNPFIGEYGSMAGQRCGRGVIEGETPLIRFHAKEHGILMAISTLVPDIGYYQGLHKCWTRGVRNVKTDYLCPEYDALGYEPIYNKELALCDLEEGSTNDDPWGFTRRYGSYCYHNNIASGDFVLKETRTGMEAFHLMRDFRDGSTGIIYAPALNASFTQITPSQRLMYDRIFQIIGSSMSEIDHFEGFHQVYCQSVLPKSPNSMASLEEDEHTAGKSVNIDNGGVRF